MRFFKTIPDVYSQTRTGLDNLFGHPKLFVSEDGIEVVTLSCLPSVKDSFHISENEVLVPVSQADCDMPEVSVALDNLLGAGLIQELTESEYWQYANSVN